MDQPSKALLQAIAVAAELTGTTMTEPAARVMASDLARYPEHQVLAALTRCRRDLKGRMTIADVLTRIDDGRPGAEEAWAAIPTDEGASVVWTDEMAEAFGVANPLIQDGDKIAARMAFTERYRVLVREARELGKPVHWTPSLGHDAGDREGVLLAAVRAGCLAPEHAHALLPRDDGSPKRLQDLLERTPIVRQAPALKDAAA